MKHLILSLVFLCGFFSLGAQNYEETVYLKNGSIIRGIIVEQVPNESLKIQTRDGNLFVYSLNEVEKITKEGLEPSYKQSNNSSDKVGYKGFVDLGYSIGVGESYKRVDRLEFSTSHGYQFNPYFYLGAGAGLNYFHDAEIVSVPLFANPRLNLPTNGPVSPFIDLKIGYTVSEYVKGFYLAPSVGLRFDLKDNKALNFTVGYTMQKVRGTYYYYYDSYYGSYYDEYSSNVNAGAITLKLGFEF